MSAWRVVLLPGASSPVHALTADEAFVALRGSADVELDGAVPQLRGGDCLVIPPGAAFRIANRGAEPFEAVACMAAGGAAVVGDGEPFTPPWAA